jgi:prepilin-type N-terminal cleavage/methylation domain-containing protein
MRKWFKKKFFRSNKNQFQSGFTLVEMLAVLAITGVVGTLMFQTLSSTLRGANKSDSIATIQQNGNFALSQMSRMVRYAVQLESPTSCYSGPTPAPVVSSSITILNLDNHSTTFSCDTSSGSFASNSANMLNTQAVAVTACSFSCYQANPYDSPTMTISFTLNKKNANNLVENNSPVNFQTSITMRNINQ